MATNTMVALATQTLNSAVSSVTFSSIPQGYTDLVIETVTKQSIASSYCGIQFNGDTTNNYSQTNIAGNGSTAVSHRGSNIPKIYPLFNTYESTSNWLTTKYHIQNYSNATTYKTVLIRANDSSQVVQACVGTWRKTPEAITSIVIGTQSDSGSGTFAIGSTFTVYGIAANSETFSAKATGGTITSDISYWYHTFTSSGTFSPTQSITADILVVAGGGGPGGFASAGAGGAGGLLGFTSQSLTTTSYTVTVGAGGAAGVNNWYSLGSQGGNSQFGALTAAVGGGGGRSYNAQDNLNAYRGGDGGSGGGGGSNNGYPGNGTTGQGYAGGYGLGDYAHGGGGGGAGGAGNTYHAGPGVGTYSTWGVATGTGVNVSGTYYYAGGGNAKDGATTNGASAPGVAGASNTGQGGGAIYSPSVSGGSGVVIIRYPK